MEAIGQDGNSQYDAAYFRSMGNVSQVPWTTNNVNMKKRIENQNASNVGWL